MRGCERRSRREEEAGGAKAATTQERPTPRDIRMNWARRLKRVFGIEMEQCVHCGGRLPNGNGRHARTAADLLLLSLGRDRFSWGSANLIDVGATRAAYVAALGAADNHEYGPLLAFVRS
jgi:hypothetical protein